MEVIANGRGLSIYELWETVTRGQVSKICSTLTPCHSADSYACHRIALLSCLSGEPMTEVNDKGTPPRKKRGFAAISPERQREIASLGGRAAHQSGKAHEFNSDEARAARQKRGLKNTHGRYAVTLNEGDALGNRSGDGSGMDLPNLKEVQARTAAELEPPKASPPGSI